MFSQFGIVRDKNKKKKINQNKKSISKNEIIKKQLENQLENQKKIIENQKKIIENQRSKILLQQKKLHNNNINIQFKNKENEILKKLENLDIFSEYDVFMFTYIDWCNTMYRYKKGLEENGKKVFALKLFSKSCGIFFPEEVDFLLDLPAGSNDREILSSDLCILNQNYKLAPPIYLVSSYSEKVNKKINNIITKSKLVYFHAETIYNPMKNNIHAYQNLFKNRKTVMGLAGNFYRKHPEIFLKYIMRNKLDNVKLLCQCPDLMGYNNVIPEELVYYGVDTNLIKFKERDYNNKLIISHYATNEKTKGTTHILKAIERILKEFPEKFVYKGIKDEAWKSRVKSGSFKLNWNENIKRMSECDIYIETCNLELDYGNGNIKKFGEWGNTCLEASATGCIVLTNSLTKDYYMKEYTKDYPLLISNNTEEIYNNLHKIAMLSKEELKELSKKYRTWIENNHSLKATGERFIKKFF